MKQVNLKSDHLAALLEDTTKQTGETKVEARLQALKAEARSVRTLEWLQAVVWPNLSEAEHGHAPSEEEQEELLGF